MVSPCSEEPSRTAGLRRLARLDTRARLQPVLAVDDDPVAGCQAIGDDCGALADVPDSHGANLDRIVGSDAKDICAVLSALDRLGRDHRGGIHGRDLHSCIDEFVGPQGPVRVVEQRLELDMPGALIDLAVDEDQLAGGERLLTPRL
jgi:hypothetical protein